MTTWLDISFVFTSEAQALLKRILQFRPVERISINDILHDRWTLGETAGFNAFALLEAEEEEVRGSLRQTGDTIRTCHSSRWDNSTINVILALRLELVIAYQVSDD